MELSGELIRPPIDELYRIAKQYSRRQEEADDLVQDLLLEAVSTGKDFSDTRFLDWGRGFLRNRAAFIARTEGRRRKREGHFHPPDPVGAPLQLPESFIISLRPTLRIVARLSRAVSLFDHFDARFEQLLVALEHGGGSCGHNLPAERPECSSQHAADSATRHPSRSRSAPAAPRIPRQRFRPESPQSTASADRGPCT